MRNKTILLIICMVVLSGCTPKKVIGTEPISSQAEQKAEKVEEVLSEEDSSYVFGEEAVSESEKGRKSKKINIKAIGDIMLGRGVAYHTKADYTMPFKQTAEFLRSGDITFANMEFTLSDRGQKLEGKINLRAEPKAVEGVNYAGIDVVNIANNHIMDYNEVALIDTMEILNQNNIKYIGAGKNLTDARNPAIIEVKGVKVGFLAYSDFAHYGFWDSPEKKNICYFWAKENSSGVAPLTHQDDKNGNPVKYETGPIIEDIKKLRNQVDLIAVSFHWGVENSHNVPSLQRELGQDIIDAGADMILGHHPHVLQGIEIYKGKPIIYSMGNFIFDQNERPNNEGMVVDMDFTDGKLSRLEVSPLQVVAKKETVFAKGDAAARIMGYIKKLSEEQMNTMAQVNDGKLIFDIK
ncbi:MAG: CapA family protein [Clostridia bacterium]